MKRCLLTLYCLLLGLALKAQSPYTCQYWFDQDHGQAVTTTFEGDLCQMEIDAGSLSAGLHTLCIMVQDTTETWCAPRSYLFYQTTAWTAANVICHFWFDQDFGNRQSMPFGTGQFLLDADNLEMGLHLLNVTLENEGLTTTEQYLFYRDPSNIDPTNPTEVVCHYWFDQDFENMQSMPFGTGQFLLDTGGLSEGLHLLNVTLEYEGLTTTEQYLFYRDPSQIDPTNTAEVICHFWFDEDFEHKQSCPFGTGGFLLDTRLLGEGQHTVYILLESESLTTSTQSYTFEKHLVEGHVIVTIVNPTGTGTLSGQGWYELGDTCTLIATANPGYVFENWSNEGNIVSDSSTYSFAVTEDATFVANFACVSLGEFTYMSPTNNYPFTSLPITFSWDAVDGAEYYDLYVWDVEEQMPDEPFASYLTRREYRTASLLNYHTYNWYVKAKNHCHETSSGVKSFYLDITPSLNVNAENINFGEVALNQSTSTTLNVTGVVLEDIVNVEIVGEDANMFSFVKASGWNDFTGGILIVTFHPTTAQYSYNADLVISSGTHSQTTSLIGGLADMYVFNTYVNDNVYAMNTPIPIYGSVTDLNNEPVANAEVEVGVFVMNTKRTLQSVTDANGQFEAIFEPYYAESGHYTINSGRVGNNSIAVHDEFDIPGMMLVSSDYNLCAVTQDQPHTDSILIRNKSNLALSNITVATTTAPDGASFSFMPLSLGGLEEGYLVYTANGFTLTQGDYYEEAKLKATSSEGAEMNLSIWYYCMEPRGVLDVMPKSLATTMTKGNSKIVDVMLTNNGTGETGDIYIDLPDVEWMSVVGSDTLSSIAINDTAYFSLRFSPGEDIQLVQYSGTIAINSERGDAIALPYMLTAVSDSTGMLVVDVTDDYTWNTNNGNGPHLEGAEVILQGYYSLETVAQGYTDAYGHFNVDNLPEGYYRLQVSADHHSQYNDNIFITAGETNNIDVYLQYQAITYSWNVVPTEIEDEYTYELIVDFETNVPVPVITIEHSGIHDLEYGESANFSLIITNHGLISAFDTHIYFNVSDEYIFSPLFDVIDTLEAQTTYIVPGTYCRTNNRMIDSRSKCDNYCTTISVYYCNNNGTWTSIIQNRSLPFPIGTYTICSPDYNDDETFIPNGNGIFWWYFPTHGNSSGHGTPSTGHQVCKPCVDALIDATASCVSHYVPGGCNLTSAIADLIKGYIHNQLYNEILQNIMLDQVNCYVDDKISQLTDPLLNEITGGISGAISCLKDFYDELKKCIKIEIHSQITNHSRGNMDNIQNTIDGLYYSTLYFSNELEFVKSFFPEDTWDTEENISEFFSQFRSLINSTTGLVPESAAVSFASSFIGTSITYDDIINFVNRWNRSVEYWSNGYFMTTDLPVGYDTEFIQIDTSMINYMTEIEDYYASIGYEGIQELYEESVQNAMVIAENASQSSVCAKVTVQFSQKMTMTREAFEGTLTIHNGHDTNPMEAIAVNFVIKDEDGNDCTSLFQINTLSLNNITGIDGSGSIGGGSDGVAKIQFIPTKQAAPTEPKVYYFGGSFSFIDPFTGEEILYDLYPVEITVNPSPDLYVDYFMQRDILGDDALTLDKVEPSVPAELGVIINNKGAGTAKNVMLETAEPQIIDNDKGLAIDFEMYGASFNGSPRQLGLMEIPFGNIESGHTAVGEWLFTSTLLGHFVSYEAHVIHNSSYGNSDLSLVSHLDIHELIHPIYAYGNLDDGINDFLVNDVMDAYDMPDSIYFSNGGKTAVGVVDNISYDHVVTPLDTIVTLTINPSRIGWNYGVCDDPGADKYDIVSCTRNIDNQEIPLSNVWQTFVTIPDGGDPVYENKLHIVDTLSNDVQNFTYTLVYSLKTNLLDVEEITGIPESYIDYPLESFTVKFNEAIIDSTFTYEDMTLKCQNGPNLMDESVVITKVDETIYNVNISNITNETGLFVLNVNTLNICDTRGYGGYNGKQASWVQMLIPDSIYISSEQLVCENMSFEPLTAEIQGNAVSYQWNLNGNPIEGANDMTYQPTTGGVYSLTVTFANGNVMTSNEVTLMTHQTYEIPITAEICFGEDYTLNGFNLIAPEVGTHNETLNLQSVHGCDSIVSLTLTVFDNPVIVINGDTSVQAGQSVTLTASGGNSYIWSTGETTASIVVTPSETTTYSVVGTDSHGCSDDAEITVTIITGIGEEELYSAIKIYPNPTHNGLIVEGENISSITIMNSLGVTVYKISEINKEKCPVNMTNYPNGIYYLKITTNDGETIRKVVKY